MINGFSRLSKKEKQNFVLNKLANSGDPKLFQKLKIEDQILEELVEGFSENVIASFPFPYSIAPNFLIDNKEYLIPFVTEESSVVAAAAKAAKFWHTRGGFQSEIIGNTKNGHIHFKCDLSGSVLQQKITSWNKQLIESVKEINQKMILRGGGIQYITLIDKNEALNNYSQLEIGFNTCDAMGANYINSCLEGVAAKLSTLMLSDEKTKSASFEVIMSILSNYSPQNAVKVWVETDIDNLDDSKLGMDSQQFAHKFVKAVEIAEIDVSRAVTHNKGIYNGVDSVALATGNDWRAIEANGHAYASKDGQYRSLSHAAINNNTFKFELTLPLQVGTIGGITSLHPLTKLSLELLGNPSATELMKIMASAGLASNFAALRALTTTGIQKGHMKMHLNNILAGLNASENEKIAAKEYFANKTVSNSSVELFIQTVRNN